MAGLLESMRASHEQVEKLERLVASELNKLAANSSSSHDNDYAQLVQSHRIGDLTDRIIQVTRILVRSYEAQDHLVSEVDILGASDPFDAFYHCLGEIRSSHNHSHNDRVTLDDDMSMAHEEVWFSGEEGMGRYLDLHQQYHRYISFTGPLDYFTYLDHLYNLASSNDNNNAPSLILSKKLKARTQFRDYLADLLQYLVSFVNRTQPLMDLDHILSEVETAFEGRCRGCYNSKKGKHMKATLLMEAKLKKLCELLKNTIARTKEHVKNRSAMSTLGELQEDRDQDNQMMILSDDEEDTNNSNPLKLPLGWDGKPIPYWLYKLHGLSQEFKCEICGDHTYRGRREFERHFGEGRHQSGMGCLGIPNAYAKCFHEITRIADAQKLWKEIQRKEGLCKWAPEVDEEFEDDEGNVYDKKTYAYLKRQRLI